MSGKRALRYRAARILHATVHGVFFEDRHHVRAAALTYFTVLSIVPLLAFVFALLKGFGAYDLLIEESIRPYVMRALAGNAPLRTAFEQILGFVENTGVTSLGLVGLLTLLYAATRLLRNIEVAFNEIWGVNHARDPLEQLRDYLALIVITPICLMGAAALTTAGQALQVLRAAGDLFGLSAIVDAMVGVLGPLVVLFAGLTVLYVVMPHARVRARSAFVGAAVGGLAWYVLLLIHVKFQIGVARFNALYSSFGAIPIFLAWLQVSWVVILVGAQVAATHQQTERLAQRKRLPPVDTALREISCLSVMLEVTRAFLHGDKPPTVPSLSRALDVPEPMLGDWLDELAAAGLVTRTQSEGAAAYVLGTAPERIQIKHVLDALRWSPEATPAATRGRTARLESEAGRLWLTLDRELSEAPTNRNLRELVEPQS